MIPLHFLLALITVESGGRDHVIGDQGRAYGCLQIWEEVVKDVNRVYGTRYTHADCLKRAPSLDICRLYLSHYASPQRLGRQPTLEDLARIWNGGPKGHRLRHTEPYWAKVRPLLYD